MSLETPIAAAEPLLPWRLDYRLVVFDAPGDGFRIVEIEAGDDAEALVLGCREAGASAFELWDARKILGRYEAKG